MSHDTLSDVLRAIRLRSAVYFNVSCEGEWVAEAPASRDIAAAVMPGADHVIEYHMVTMGECWAAVVGEKPCRLKRGDIVLLPQGDPHVVSSAPDMRADADANAYFAMRRDQRPFRVHYAGGSEVRIEGKDSPVPMPELANAQTSLVCGFIGCDARPFNPLLGALPRLLHVPAERTDQWSSQLARLAVMESNRRSPGSGAVLERLSETMFVDAIRRHIDSLTDQSNGWLAGLRDRHVGRTLSLMHEQPARAWTLDALGSEVGLSRSALHQRFVELVGQPPMQYLAQWRMQLASQLLRDTHSGIASIAMDVGYDSEAAFVRAFKRLLGTPPATWRRQQAPATGSLQRQ